MELLIVCQIMSIGQTVTEILRFLIFKMSGVYHLGFSKLWNFNSRGGEGQNVSPCQISWLLVKPLPRYGNFLIFQNGSHRCLNLILNL